MNMVPHRQGTIDFSGKNIFPLQTEEIVKQGISFVPQGNRVFGELSVRENLEIGGYLIKSKQEVDQKIGQLLGLFPDLKDRIKENAGTLSGGEKQQLALARALMLSPKVLLLDEPSLGLAPKLVTQAFALLKKIQSEFGTTMVIVEQKVVEVLHIASRVIAFRMGETAFDGTPEEIKNGEMLKKIFLV
jgi:branched-chain amino acid transport system ATP-binding protein